MYDDYGFDIESFVDNMEDSIYDDEKMWDLDIEKNAKDIEEEMLDD
jgi:hypothetical protein